MEIISRLFVILSISMLFFGCVSDNSHLSSNNSQHASIIINNTTNPTSFNEKSMEKQEINKLNLSTNGQTIEVKIPVSIHIPLNKTDAKLLIKSLGCCSDNIRLQGNYWISNKTENGKLKCRANITIKNANMICEKFN